MAFGTYAKFRCLVMQVSCRNHTAISVYTALKLYPRPCHTMVHGVAANEELARNFYTMDLLLAREDVQKWRRYAAKQRFGIRRG